MVDFEEMARKAQAAHDGAIADAEAARKAAAEQREAKTSAGVAALSQHVLPVLQDAISAFRKQGIHSKYKQDFDVKNYVSREPSVTFWCIGPSRPQDDWRWDAPPVTFESDGENIFLKVSQNEYSTRAELKVGQVIASNSTSLIAKGVERALESYYKTLKSHGGG